MRKEIQLRFHNIVSNQRYYMVVNAGPFVKEFANEISTLFERGYIKGQDQKWGNEEEMECRR